MASKSSMPLPAPDPWEIFGPNIMVQAPYRVIYADPPWASGPGGDGWLGGMQNRSYSTMSGDAIANLPIPLIAAPDAVLVLWTCWMYVGLAVHVMESWGFKQCAGFPWLKTVNDGSRPVFGPGIWARHCTEPLLIGRRGKPFGSMGNPRPAREGLIVTPRQEHSRKPEAVADWINEWEIGPKIELFARRPRPGWVIWGNEVECG